MTAPLLSVPHERGADLKCLFDTILEYIPAPEGDDKGPLQMLVSSIDYNEYVGRIGIGRIERGEIKVGQEVMVTNFHSTEPPKRTKIVSLYQIDGLQRIPVESAKMGDIICFSGASDVTIGDTITAVDCVEPLEFVKVSEPTLEMTFSVNDSPFAGREGKFVTSRQLRERLYKELLRDVSLRVEDGETTDCFKVAGRGEMHLSILIETMRREGYELTCSMPHVLFKTIDGVKCEPMEHVTIDVPEEYDGTVIQKLGARKGDLLEMNLHGSRMRIEYLIPARCLFGYRSEFLTDTRGEGIISSIFDSYQPYRGDITLRYTGSLVASEDGETTSYGLYQTQDRGQMFIGVQTPVYEGMIIGESLEDRRHSGQPLQEKTPHRHPLLRRRRSPHPHPPEDHGTRRSSSNSSPKTNSWKSPRSPYVCVNVSSIPRPDSRLRLSLRNKFSALQEGLSLLRQPHVRRY